MPPSGPWRATDGGIQLLIRAQPRARADRIAGLVEDAAGGVRLKVCVTAVPEAGQANAAICKLVARALKVAKSSVSVTSGQTARDKVLALAGVDAAALERLIGMPVAGGRSAKGK